MSDPASTIALGPFNQMAPPQTEIKQISGSPEGVIYAQPGYMVSDPTGIVYVKRTDVIVNTGWKKLTLTDAP